jgi:hypothetical protein
LRKILAAESPDIVVCLGDWFDSFFHNTTPEVEATCDFLKKFLQKDNCYTLMGNHDIQYLYDNATLICSGYERGKKNLISTFFGRELIPTFREKFLWYIWVDDFLCTHAGLHPVHLPPMMKLNHNNVSGFLDTEIRRAEDALISGERFWLYGGGRVRGGSQPRGGINWLDFNHEFEPIEGLKQIVGHTTSAAIRTHHADGTINPCEAENLCIDCHLNQYLLITNKVLTIKKFSEL